MKTRGCVANVNIFQDNPEPKTFSSTFQVLEILQKKSRTFQEAWELIRYTTLKGTSTLKNIPRKTNIYLK